MRQRFAPPILRRAVTPARDRDPNATPTDRYPVPAGRHSVEQAIRRSRFIATLGRASEPHEARAFIAGIADQFSDATHNCWAFVAGPPGSTTQVGMSDAGEPQGTAGRPILTALLHGGVGEIVAVVTRYYGGVKLGRGGLGRAYSSSVQAALESLPLAERVLRMVVGLELDYTFVDPVLKLLDEIEAVRLDEEFGAVVRFRVAVPEDRVVVLSRRFAEITAGAGSFLRETE